MSHICLAKSIRTTFGTHFLYFLKKPATLLAFLILLGILFHILEKIFSMDTYPKKSRMDVWSREAVTPPSFISRVLWKFKNFVRDISRNNNFYFKNFYCYYLYISLMEDERIILYKQRWKTWLKVLISYPKGPFIVLVDSIFKTPAMTYRDRWKIMELWSDKWLHTNVALL